MDVSIEVRRVVFSETFNRHPGAATYRKMELSRVTFRTDGSCGRPSTFFFGVRVAVVFHKTYVELLHYKFDRRSRPHLGWTVRLEGPYTRRYAPLKVTQDMVHVPNRHVAREQLFVLAHVLGEDLLRLVKSFM